MLSACIGCDEMMTKKISISILGHSGERVKRFTIPITFLFVLTLATFSVVAFFGFVIYGYHGLRQSIVANGQMARTIMDQRDEITQQRLQIQSFADDINVLKDNLVTLNHFEEKIRVIANLDPGKGNGSLFGVGGATPDDLVSQLALTQRHEGLMREMHRQVNELNTATLHQEDNFGTLLNKLEGQRSLLASTPAIRPTSGWLSSRFGYRVSPFTGRKEFHKGVDIANHKGTAIMATANGVVTYVGKKGGMGNVVVIDHGHGMITRYAHLSQALKKRGETVKRGDIIAQMGSSGRSTGPHLHYEVRLNGVPVNPAKYILN